MKKKGWLLIVFCILALLQIAVPASIIARRENVIRTGMQLKFKAAPANPADPFSGRYVALRVEEGALTGPQNIRVRYGQKVYAAFGVDENGFAVLKGIYEKPPEGAIYVRAHVRYGEEGNARLDFPFQWYYMSEEAAPEAEEIYRKRMAGKDHDTYITVRVKSGYAVLEGLFIDGIPIEEFIRK